MQREKRLGQITVHLTPEEERAFRALAEAEGRTASDMGRSLCMGYLEERRDYFEALRDVFDDSTERTEREKRDWRPIRYTKE